MHVIRCLEVTEGRVDQVVQEKFLILLYIIVIHQFVLPINFDGKRCCLGLFSLLYPFLQLPKQMGKKEVETERKQTKQCQDFLTHFAVSLASLPSITNPYLMYLESYSLAVCFEALPGAGQSATL